VRSCSSRGIARLGSIYAVLASVTIILLGTYDLAIQVVLLYHDGVDALGVPEGEEAEASRASGSGVAHNSTFADLTEL
jgi:hypothetical protein